MRHLWESVMATTQLELWDPPLLKAERERVEPSRGVKSPAVRAPVRAPAANSPRDQSAGGNSPSASLPSVARPSLLDSLRERVARIETAGRGEPLDRFSCGAAALDRMLPGGGLAPGTINEWIGQSEGCGAGWLSLLAARSAMTSPVEGASHWEMGGRGTPPRSSAPPRGSTLSRSGGHFVVIDATGAFYPPASIAAGIPAERTIVVRPSSGADFLWAADQALRSRAVAVVWGVIDRIDDRDARRLQLAAEAGNSLGLFIRPRTALSEPSWAEVRWHVRGLPSREAEPAERCGMRGAAAVRRIEARLVRCRGGRSGGSVMLVIDSAGQLHLERDLRHGSLSTKTAALPLAAQLARPAAAQLDRRRRRA